MIALEVSVNGHRLCVAGAEDLHVLNAAFSIGGKLGPHTPTSRPSEQEPNPTFHIGGVTSPADRKGEHVRWAQETTYLAIGDVVDLRFVRVERADDAASRPASQEDIERLSFEMAKAKYLSLKNKFESEP